MTLNEAIKTYDVSIIYWDEGWSWKLSSGYCQTDSEAFDTPNEARDSLIEYLKDWKGFDK